jgi:hypothetical protein
VLQDVAEQHDIEGRKRCELVATAGVLDVTDDELLAVLARTLSGDGVSLDARDAAAARHQLGGEVAGRAADVEDARPTGHGLEQQPMRGREAVLGNERRVRRAGPGLRLVVDRGQRSGS